MSACSASVSSLGNGSTSIHAILLGQGLRSHTRPPTLALRRRFAPAYLRCMGLSRLSHSHPDARAWSQTGRLFAIVDATGANAVLEKVAELGNERAVSLFRGSAEEEFESVAPYLVAVDSSVFDWISATFGQEPWGVFIHSGSDLAALRTHFRKFLTVKSPEGDDWYFRYYDPRVLEPFLESCTTEELDDFFGPVERFGLSDGQGGMLSLSPSARRTTTMRVRVVRMPGSQ
jgi:hypothetical protein